MGAGLEHLLHAAEKDLAAATTKICCLRSCIQESDLSRTVSYAEWGTSSSQRHRSSGSELADDMAPCGGESCSERLAAAHEQAVKWRAEAERLRRELVHAVRDAGFAGDLENTWREAMADLQEDLEVCSLMVEEAAGSPGPNQRARRSSASGGGAEQPLNQLLFLQRAMRRLMLGTMKLHTRSNRLPHMNTPSFRSHQRPHSLYEQESHLATRPSTANSMLPDLPEGDPLDMESLGSTGPPTHRRTVSDPMDAVQYPAEPSPVRKFARSISSGPRQTTDHLAEVEAVITSKTAPGELLQPSACPPSLNLGSEAAAQSSADGVDRAASSRGNEYVDNALQAAPATLPAAVPSTHRRSISVQGTDSSGRTSLSKLVITGTMHHGGSLIAKGVQHGGKRCLFQWFVTPVGCNEWQTVRGARRPDLRTTLADVGCKFRCDAVPVGEDGSQGLMRSAFSKIITLDPFPGNALRQKMKDSPAVRFAVKLLDKENPALDGSAAVLSVTSSSLTVVLAVGAGEQQQQQAGADREVLSVAFPSLATALPPPVIVVVDRTAQVLKLATMQRAGAVALEARSGNEQGMIAVAIKTLYPPAAVIPSDYKVHLKGMLPRKESQDPVSLAQYKDTQRHSGRTASMQDIPAGSSASEAALRLSMAPLVAHLQTPSPSTPVRDSPPVMRSQLSIGDAMSGTSRTLLFGHHDSPQQLDQLHASLAIMPDLPSPLGRQQSENCSGYTVHSQDSRLSALPRSISSDTAFFARGEAAPPATKGTPDRRTSLDSGVRSIEDTGYRMTNSGPHMVEMLDLTGTGTDRSAHGGTNELEQLSPTSVEGIDKQYSSSLPIFHVTKGLADMVDSFNLDNGGPPSLQDLCVEGSPVVGSTLTVKHSMPSNVSYCLYQWQRIFEEKAGEADQYGDASQGSLGMQTILGADGPSYTVTPDDLAAVIRVCCIPVDLSGLKGLTSYICLNEGNPVSMPKHLQQQVDSYQSAGCGVFQVHRLQGQVEEACVLTVDSKSMCLRSKTGRTVLREKYHTGLADFQLAEDPRWARIVVSKPSTPGVVIKLRFEDNLQRDTATLLLRSLAGADAARRKESSSSNKGMGFLRRGLSASLTNM
eukprot:CAMPEP_0117656722 /NCGR_PEP_ID=MMETSP0804-20121206/4954_1 /TAXON_ID=1074897 /ORGANISM="Tetraselmis astigmatica, Strain CCMP880" /LENGTH=1103 /DNA_ID=CAMNT_0005463139 /DNA_START=365 /DNA_END=3676 /DNA_ORIENTATION=+